MATITILDSGYVKLTVDGNKIIDNKTGKPYGFDTDDMKVDSKVKTLNPGQSGRRFEGGLPLIPIRINRGKETS